MSHSVETLKIYSLINFLNDFKANYSYTTNEKNSIGILFFMYSK